MGLRERAAGDEPGGAYVSAEEIAQVRAGAAGEDLPDIEYTGEIADAEQVPVHVAWARVMADVQSIGKGDNYNQQGTRYQYRGVDRVLNAVGPALRRHGVLVMPIRTEPSYRDVTTKSGTRMSECTVTVTYEITGPKGDTKTAQSCGEAMDSGDKSTTKACTVAYRNLLITALSIPTRDPRLDAEASNHDRGEQPLPKPTDYRDEIANLRTSLGRLKQIRGELAQHNLAGVVVTNEVGDEEQLGVMLQRIGRERQEVAG